MVRAGRIGHELPSSCAGTERVDGGREPMPLETVDLVLSAVHQPVEVEEAARLGTGPQGTALCAGHGLERPPQGAFPLDADAEHLQLHQAA